ncbi:MAG: hypothetical protein V7L05_09635 [Nostoc sp.]|uniref:hypothetical protein n=1 Tax=Nostoc sp. TaxID=1180 RepID=UPI002FF6759F
MGSGEWGKMRGIRENLLPLSLVSSVFPMPNAQCPMPNAQCPMPNAQCPMPNLSFYRNIRCF